MQRDHYINSCTGSVTQFRHEGLLYRERRLQCLGYKKQWCILTGRLLQFFALSDAVSGYQNQKATRKYIIHRILPVTTTDDQIVVEDKRGKFRVLKFATGQLEEKEIWIRALQTVLLFDEAAEHYGDNIAQQLLGFARKQMSNNASVLVDEEMNAAIRKRSISDEMWNRFAKLMNDGLQLDVLSGGLPGGNYFLQSSKLANGITISNLSFDCISEDPMQIEIAHITSIKDCMECEPPRSMTRFSLNIVHSNEPMTIILEAANAETRSLLVFGISRLISNYNDQNSSTTSKLLKQLDFRRRSSAKPLEPTFGGHSLAMLWDEGKLLDSCIRRFNVNPKKGIQHAIKCGIISSKKDDEQPNQNLLESRIAKFLLNVKGLNKEKVGDLLGLPDDIYLKVLDEFAKGFHFKQKSFENCLRDYLSKFRLPGESQKIDRIMESFSKSFYAQNPDVLCSQDTVHILAFSTIMLNTDAHNPSLGHRNRMTKDDFIRNNRGIADGKDVSSELLGNIYDNITIQPLITETNRDDYGNLFTEPDMSGWMKKYSESGIRFSNKKWYMLSNHCLYYFNKKEDIDPVGFIPLENLRVAMVPGQPRRMELLSSLNENCGFKTAKYKNYDSLNGSLMHKDQTSVIFKADTEDQCLKWIYALQNNIVHSSNNASFSKKKSDTIETQLLTERGSSNDIFDRQSSLESLSTRGSITPHSQYSIIA